MKRKFIISERNNGRPHVRERRKCNTFRSSHVGVDENFDLMIGHGAKSDLRAEGQSVKIMLSEAHCGGQDMFDNLNDAVHVRK